MRASRNYLTSRQKLNTCSYTTIYQACKEDKFLLSATDVRCAWIDNPSITERKGEFSRHSPAAGRYVHLESINSILLDNSALIVTVVVRIYRIVAAVDARRALKMGETKKKEREKEFSK